METLIQDVRYALRMLVKRPGFTSIAIVTLALGIGANTAIFSVVNGVLLRPLPYQGPERLVALWETNAKPGMEANFKNEVALANFLDWRAQQSVFDSIAALAYTSVNLTGDGEPERIQGAVVTTNLFQVLGVQPLAGRAFFQEEENPTTQRSVVLSYGLWQRRFGSDETLLGKTLTLNGNPVTVAGVMPPDFELQFPTSRQVDMWLPMRINAASANRQAHYLYVVGRLKQGVGLEQAHAEMNLIANRLEQQYPETNANKGANVIALHEQMVGSIKPYLYVLFAAVGFVLLIACANVANLMLARSASRRKEIAVRMALGASRFRLARQLLTESLLLSILGGAVGLLIAFWAIDLLVGITPDDAPRLGEVGLHREVFAWTLGVSIITGVLFGLAPALGASKIDVNESLKESGKGSGGRFQNRTRNLLVVAEVALALVLLAGAGLMMRSFARLQQATPGFEPENVLTMNISLPSQKYNSGEQVNAFFNQLFERVQAVPGIEAVGGIDPLPLSGSNATTGFVVEGEAFLAVTDRPEVGERTITPGYFHAMRIPILKGRVFAEQDGRDSPRVVVVNEALARRFWPDGEAIGKRLGFEASGQQDWHEIIGVVGNVKHERLNADPKPELYFCYGQQPRNFMSFVARASQDPAGMIAAVRNEVLALDPNQPTFDIKTMQERISKTIAPTRFILTLLGVFSILATILAAVGIYGVISYAVSQRTQEIGIRMALGAQRSDVLKLVIGRALALALVGVVMGLVAAFGVTRLMSSLLYEVTATDPLTFVSVAFVLGAIALLASFIPARRATKVDPIVALRYE